MMITLDRAVSPSSLEEEHYSPMEGDTSKPSASCMDEEEASATGGLPNDDAVPEGTGDIPKPKRPLSAYNMFFRDQREMLLETLPCRQSDGKGHGKIGFQDLARVIGAKWRDIDPQEKERYEKIAAEGREKYLEHTRLWKKQQKEKGLPTTRRKKKEKRNKVPEVAKKPYSEPGSNSLMQMSRAVPSLINRGEGMSQARRALSLPQFNAVQGMDSHQGFPTSLGSRVVSGIPSEIGIRPVQEPIDLDAFADYDLVDQYFPSHEGSLSMPASAVARNQTSQQRHTSTFAHLPELAPTPFRFERFPIDEAPAMASSSTFPAFHPLENNTMSHHQAETPVSGNYAEIVEPLPFEPPLAYDSFDDLFQTTEMEQQLQEFYSSCEPQQQSLENLADRMGPDCVDLFVGIFGSD